jgi:hypothetical protein
MTNPLLLLAACLPIYILPPALADQLPLHGLAETQQTPLCGHVSDQNQLHASKYLVNKNGLILWRITRYPKTAMLKRGDRILTIDGHQFTLTRWMSTTPDINYHLVIKHKDGTIEEKDWQRLYPWET